LITIEFKVDVYILGEVSTYIAHLQKKIHMTQIAGMLTFVSAPTSGLKPLLLLVKPEWLFFWEGKPWGLLLAYKVIN